MPLFTDAQDVYDTLGRLFVGIANEAELAPKFRKANTIVRYQYSEPEPEVTMRMAADTAHRFWLGEVNVTVALARGEIKAEGPVAKILALVPLTKPLFPRYKALLEADGHSDLVNVD